MHEQLEVVEAAKDEDTERPVASAWRPTFREVVRAFVEGDFGLSRGIPSVAPISSSTAKHIEAYVLDYGETLAELPEEAWETSVSLWMGTHWAVLVDLWTVESGSSDMVLDARVSEAEGGFLVEIHLVYVP